MFITARVFIRLIGYDTVLQIRDNFLNYSLKTYAVIHQQNGLTDALAAICSSLRDFGTQRAASLRISKRSCKTVEMPSCEMPFAYAISST